MPDVDGPLALLVLPPWGWLVAGLLGALWGSFFNVAIHRLGLYESVVHPPSHCPRCGHGIAARDNIPIFGWLILGGKCRHCGLPISIRYPLVELLTLLLALAVYWRFVIDGQGDVVSRVAHFLVYFTFTGSMIVISGIDLDHKIIPDTITYPAVPVFFIFALVLRDIPASSAVIGMVAGYGSVAITAELGYWLLGREAMGYGDAKLLMMVGALLGWKAVVFSYFGAPIVGVCVVIPALVARRGRVAGVEIPYGPFLAVAALAYLFFGRQILSLIIF